MKEEKYNPEIIDQSVKKQLNWIDSLIGITGVLLAFFIATVFTIWFSRYVQNESLTLYFNAFISQFLMLIIILIIKKGRRWTWADLGFKYVNMSKLWGKVIGLYGLSILINLVYVFYVISLGYTPPETDAYSQLLGQSSIGLILLNIVLVGFIAPFIEEGLFRGIIYQGFLSHFGPWTSAMINAAIFAGLHLQAYGFIPRFALALMLVYLFKKYNSIYPSIALHALNNLIAVILAALVI